MTNLKQVSNQELENYLFDHIPISRAMGIKVELATIQKIILSAPLSNNINHKNTVFGGSLHAVATLACWSLLYVNLKSFEDDNTFQIVISNSQINYLAPVAKDFEVECAKINPLEWDRFFKILMKKGKSRIDLKATVTSNVGSGKLCVDYTGTFVAIKEIER